MPESTSLEFVRDAINGLRSDVAGVYTRLDEAVTSNQALHRDVEMRINKLENPPAAKYAWVSPLSRLLWPLCLVLYVLIKDATPTTKAQVQRVLTTSAGLPDINSGASVHPEPASSTWTYKHGGPR